MKLEFALHIPKPVEAGLATPLSVKTRECGGSSFRIMKDEGERGLWNLRSQLRKAPEARHVAGEGLLRDPERPLNEAVKVKPEFCRRPQSVGNATTMGWLPRRAAHRECNQPREVLPSAELEGWSHLAPLT